MHRSLFILYSIVAAALTLQCTHGEEHPVEKVELDPPVNSSPLDPHRPKAKASPPQVYDLKVVSEIEAILNQLYGAYCRGVASDIDALCDFEATYQRAIDAGVIKLDGVDAPERERIKREYLKNLRTKWTAGAGSNCSTDYELHRIEDLGSGLVRAYASSMNSKSGLQDRSCWYIQSTGQGNWTFVDSSYDGSFSGSTFHAVLIEHNSKLPWTKAVISLADTLAESEHEEFNGSYWPIIEQADQVIDLSPSTEITAWALQMRASGFLINQDYEDTLKDLHESDSLIGPTAFSQELRAEVYYSTEKYDLALDALTEVQEWSSLRWDLHELAAECSLSLDRPDLAIHHAELCLELNKESIMALSILALTLDEDSYPGIQDHLDATSDPEASYRLILETATDWEDHSVIEWTLPLLAEDFPESELLKIFGSD